MPNNTTQTLIHLTPDVRKMLELIAEQETSPGEKPQLSRTIRKMIREKAEQLGIELPHTKSTKQKANA